MRRVYSPDTITPDKEISLIPPDFHYYDGEAEPCFNRQGRRWQSAATVAKVGGRLFVGYSGAGDVDEGPDNYNCISYSDDDGQTWVNDYLIIDHPDFVRMHEPILWVAPDGTLWHFWAQSYVYWDGRGGVWASKCIDPAAAYPRWTAPRRLCDGVMACKPIVRSDGTWLFPVSVWHNFPSRFNRSEHEESAIYTSTDGGETLTYLGGVQAPTSTFDENCICERRDDSLLMLIRVRKGIDYTESFDGGRTWTTPATYCIPSPSARMYLGKFPSGNFFLIHHYNFKGRDHMSVLLSHDEGRSFDKVLLLDERSSVAYPDAFLDGDRVYAVYDRERYGDKEIHLAVFREADVEAQACVTEGARIKQVVCKSHGPLRTEAEKANRLWPREYCTPVDTRSNAPENEQYFK